MSHRRNNTLIAALVTALACLPVLPVPPAAAAAQSGPEPVPLTSLAIVPVTARLTRERRYATVRTKRSWLRWRLRASNVNGRAIALERRPRYALRVLYARGPPGQRQRHTRIRNGAAMCRPVRVSGDPRAGRGAA
jgi:hypothetical protein